MDRVAESLFVGTSEDAQSETRLRNEEIERIISLTHASPDSGFPEFVSVTQVPLIDGPRNDREKFEAAVDAVCAALDLGEPVLVHCSRGASRSPSVAATAHALTRECSIERAFEQIATNRDACDPHDALIRRAVNVYQDRLQDG